MFTPLSLTTLLARRLSSLLRILLFLQELRGKKIEIKDIVITEDDVVDTDTGEIETRRGYHGD